MKKVTVIRGIVLPILLLVMVSLACSLGGNTPAAATPPPSNTLPTNPAPVLSGDPTSIVVNAIQILPTLSYRKLEWFTNDQASTPDTTQPPTLVAEFTPPNNSYVVWGEDEYLTLGSNFYSRKTGEAWSLDVPGAVNQNAPVQMAATLTQAIQNNSLTIQAAGSEVVNGVPVQVFQFSGQVDAQGTIVSLEGKVWIGGDGRMVKMELDYPATRQAFDISTYEYDPSIQMPVP